MKNIIYVCSVPIQNTKRVASKTHTIHTYRVLRDELYIFSHEKKSTWSTLYIIYKCKICVYIERIRRWLVCAYTQTLLKHIRKPSYISTQSAKLKRRSRDINSQLNVPACVSSHLTILNQNTS